MGRPLSDMKELASRAERGSPPKQLPPALLEIARAYGSTRDRTGGPTAPSEPLPNRRTEARETSTSVRSKAASSEMRAPVAMNSSSIAASRLPPGAREVGRIHEARELIGRQDVGKRAVELGAARSR